MRHLLRVLLLLAAWAAGLSAQEARVVPGRAAPDLTLKRLEGGEASLQELRGQPVLINFWASWCKPCRLEMPEIVSAYEAHRSQGLEVLAINLTDQERRKDVTKFVDELAMPFPVLLDVKGRVRERYGLVSLPTTVFVDSAGVVRAVHPGPMNRNELAQGLGTILPAP